MVQRVTVEQAKKLEEELTDKISEALGKSVLLESVSADERQCIERCVRGCIEGEALGIENRLMEIIEAMGLESIDIEEILRDLRRYVSYNVSAVKRSQSASEYKRNESDFKKKSYACMNEEEYIDSTIDFIDKYMEKHNNKQMLDRFIETAIRQIDGISEEQVYLIKDYMCLAYDDIISKDLQTVNYIRKRCCDILAGKCRDEEVYRRDMELIRMPADNRKTQLLKNDIDNIFKDAKAGKSDKFEEDMNKLKNTIKIVSGSISRLFSMFVMLSVSEKAKNFRSNSNAAYDASFMKECENWIKMTDEQRREYNGRNIIRNIELIFYRIIDLKGKGKKLSESSLALLLDELKCGRIGEAVRSAAASANDESISVLKAQEIMNMCISAAEKMQGCPETDCKEFNEYVCRVKTDIAKNKLEKAIDRTKANASMENIGLLEGTIKGVFSGYSQNDEKDELVQFITERMKKSIKDRDYKGMEINKRICIEKLWISENKTVNSEHENAVFGIRTFDDLSAIEESYSFDCDECMEFLQNKGRYEGECSVSAERPDKESINKYTELSDGRMQCHIQTGKRVHCTDDGRETVKKVK